MISQKTIDEVMDTARIEEVVGDFVSLKKRGSSMIGLCPFHNEKTPSFNVSPAKGIFKCFGCGEAGNSVKFVMELEKLSYPETIKFLAKKYNIQVEEDEQPAEFRQDQLERESMYLLNQWVLEYFQDQMLNTEEGQSIALSYFKERGFTADIIDAFALGYHPPGYSVLYDAALKAGYKPEFLFKTGLAIEKDGKGIDRFRGRVMFPIRQPSGKVIGFGGRILGNDKKIAKYLNSPESEIYHKSAVLYGLFEAKKAISNEDEALLVEGYTDVISLHQAGVKNVVASSGTSLTEDQIRLLRRYTNNVVMLYDGDAAGIKATFRGLDMILQQGLNVKIVSLPVGEDPDSFAKVNTADYLKDYIRREAKDFISYKTSVLKEEAAGDPIKIAGMIREVVHSLALIPDLVLRSVYLKECADKLDTDEQTLISEMNRQIAENQKKTFKRESSEIQEVKIPENLESEIAQIHAQAPANAMPQEMDVIRILLLYANETVLLDTDNEEGENIEVACRIGDVIKHELTTDELYPEESVNLRIFNYFAEVGESAFPLESFFLHHSDQEIAKRAINLTSSPHLLSENWRDKHHIFITSESDIGKKMILTAVYSFKLRRVQNILKTIRDSFSNAMEEDEMNASLERYKGLDKAKMELAKQLSYVIV
ncbi:MAG: DNA primase [Bacteroidia bacterium]